MSARAVSTLRIDNLEKQLSGQPILRGIELSAEDGELVVLVGPSGCGKSTLLRSIAGLVAPDAGTIHIADRDVTTLAPRDRDVAMVFQNYALYPHLTVRDNIAFGLKLRKVPREVIEHRTAEVAAMLGLKTLLDRYPRQLSGGQRQRVAMGRAVARRPALFLFDEPLSNLDAALRNEVRIEIRRMHQQLKTTMVYVTHDQVEAMTLADRLVVLREGRIEQQGPPLEIYERPASRFVASFMGSPAMNFLDAALSDGQAVGNGFRLSTGNVRTELSRVWLGIRPHDLTRTHDGPIFLAVDVVEVMGFEAYAHGRVGDAPFVARLAPGDHPRPGETIRLSASPDALHFFDPETDEALSS